MVLSLTLAAENLSYPFKVVLAGSPARESRRQRSFRLFCSPDVAAI